MKIYHDCNSGTQNVQFVKNLERKYLRNKMQFKIYDLKFTIERNAIEKNDKKDFYFVICSIKLNQFKLSEVTTFDKLYKTV